MTITEQKVWMIAYSVSTLRHCDPLLGMRDAHFAVDGLRSAKNLEQLSKEAWSMAEEMLDTCNYEEDQTDA